MIISRTPLRVSFFGGGTDYPAYFREHGGETLVTAIDKYLVVSVHELTEFFDHRIQVHYSRIEQVRDVDSIQISVVRETLRHLGIERGVEIHLTGQLPARTGLGSSSATTVGLLTALHAYCGRTLPPQDLAAEAVHVEQDLIRESVGCQDQYACALGGLRHLRFAPDGAVRADLVFVPQARLAELNDSLMLYYTGLQRDAASILDEQVQRTESRALDAPLHEMKAQVGEAVAILTSNRPLAELGSLLDDAWRLKRSLSSRVSNEWLDSVYARARRAGASGGKLLGAGAGGFLLLYADPQVRRVVREELHDLREVRFSFEPGGTGIIFSEPWSSSSPDDVAPRQTWATLADDRQTRIRTAS